MSQAGIITVNGGGGGSGITNIAGDVGSISGSSVKIYANNAAVNSGSSVEFVNSGTVSTLNLTDSANNTMVGRSCGTLTMSGTDNTAIGDFTGHSMTSGNMNTLIGQAAGPFLTSGNNNVFVGAGSGGDITTGVQNVLLGQQAGLNYASSESYNILIDNLGVVGESETIRIGQVGSGTGFQNSCYIAGILGNTVSNQEFVTINSSTGQLGVTTTVGSSTYFQAYLTSAQNVSGGSTSFTIVFDTAIANVGSAYNTSTGVFTAPATGFYGFSAVVFFHQLNSLTSNTQALLAYTGSVQSLRLVNQGNGAYSAGSDIIFTASWQMPMSAGDQVKIQPFADGTGTYQIFGQSASSSTFNTGSTFSGWRIS